MRCVSNEKLSAVLDGELSHNESAEIERHLAGCERCRGVYSRQRAAVAGLKESQAPSVDPQFRAEVLQRMKVKPRRPWLALVPVAALGAFWLVLAPNEFTARGGASSDIGCRFFADAVEIRTNSTIAAGAALSLDAFRTARAPKAFMAFAIDAGGEVHWLHPAYEDAASNPHSLTLAHEGFLRLPESVVLDQPNTGALQLVCLFSKEALTVKQVEAAIAAKSFATLGDVHSLDIQLRSK
jgi:anti-sigma factor RsiW